jgi:dolichol-phosphate mannosyltransferase
MKRALVTGAAGFVGANLARRLLAQGHKVHIICKPESNFWRLEDVKNELQTHDVSLADAEGLQVCLKKIKPNWIFHLAAHGAYSWQNDLERIISTNVVGTANLLSASTKTGCEAFISAGSSSEYGYKDHAPREDERIDPNSDYAVAKAAATHFCKLYAQKHSVPTAVLRLYSVYGPYEDKDRLIPTIVENGLLGKFPPLVDPEIARDFIYIDDTIAAFMALATKEFKPGSVYNVGTGQQTSLREVVTAAQELFDIKQEPHWGSMPNRKWDTSVWVANNDKLKRELAWAPKYSFKEGLAKTREWHQEQAEQAAVKSH